MIIGIVNNDLIEYYFRMVNVPETYEIQVKTCNNYQDDHCFQENNDFQTIFAFA